MWLCKILWRKDDSIKKAASSALAIFCNRLNASASKRLHHFSPYEQHKHTLQQWSHVLWNTVGKVCHFFSLAMQCYPEHADLSSKTTRTRVVSSRMILDVAGKSSKLRSEDRKETKTSQRGGTCFHRPASTPMMKLVAAVA